MSEKTAKAKRKEDEQKKNEGTEPIGKMVVTVMRNGNVQVQGFPNSFNIAMGWVDGLTRAITMYFIQAAREGKLSEQGFVERSEFILPGQNPIKVVGGLPPLPSEEALREIAKQAKKN